MFIFPSNYLKHIFEKKYKVKATNTFISPSGGVNLDIFKAKKKTGSSEVTHIGFASQLDYFKGVDDLLALINQLEASSFCFHVIEYGNVSKYLPQLKKHENIIVHKPYKKEQMYQFYHKIDLLFFPTKQESLGLVALEAMACNIPVIGPNQFALSEIIEPGISGEKYNDPCEILALIHQFCQQQEYYTPRKWINGKYDARSVQQALVSFFKEAFS